MFSLKNLSQRSMDLLASKLSDCTNAKVILSDRLKSNATITMQSRTIFLDPGACGVYDLLLLSKMLKYRYQVKKNFKEKIPKKMIKNWMEKEKVCLEKIFPKILSLSGIFHPNSTPEFFPKITWQEVEFDSLENKPPGFLNNDNIEMVDFSDMEIIGSKKDLQHLTKIIETGSLSLETWTDLPEMKIATIPGRLVTSNTICGFWDKISKKKDYFLNEVAGIKDCMLRKFEGEQNINAFTRHKRQGIHIDDNRLYQIPLSSISEERPRLFRDNRKKINTSFNPDQYLGILAVDVNQWGRSKNSQYKNNNSLYFLLARVFEELGIDFIILSFRDFRISLNSKEDVYVHTPFLLKDVNEKMGDDVWSKISKSWSYNRPSHLQHCSYQPLHMRTINKYIEKATVEKQYNFFNLFYFSENTLEGKYNKIDIFLRTMNFLQKQANNIFDREGGKWHWFGSIPSEIRTYANRSSFLSRDTNFLF